MKDLEASLPGLQQSPDSLQTLLEMQRKLGILALGKWRALGPRGKQDNFILNREAVWDMDMNWVLQFIKNANIEAAQSNYIRHSMIEMGLARQQQALQAAGAPVAS